MSKRMEYSDGPIGEVRVVGDFLPPPEELAFREEQIKVTIGLSKGSVEFFKREAARHHTQYQKIIRRLLDFYAAQFQERPRAKRRNRRPLGRGLGPSLGQRS